MNKGNNAAAIADIDSVIARIGAMIDFANGKVPKSAGTVLAESILTKVAPKPMAGASHGGNWPNWAVAAIETESFHRDFGNRSSGVEIRYFASEEDVEKWITDERQHIADCDYAYSVRGRRWSWDWGPQDSGGFNLG